MTERVYFSTYKYIAMGIHIHTYIHTYIHIQRSDQERGSGVVVHVLTLCVVTGNCFSDSCSSAETQTQEGNNLIGW